MPLIRPFQEAPAKKVFVIIIYGSYGARKTSMTLTSAKPILLDFDEGSWRAAGIVEANKFLVESWPEVKAEINNGLCNEFDTVICDTVKTAMDNFLTADIIATNPELATEYGTLKSTGWQVLSKEFKDEFISRMDGKVLVLIAHRKEVEEGDSKKWKPNISGATENIILQLADQVGYVVNEGDGVNIYFQGSSNYISKDTAGLKKISVPELDDPRWPTFFQDEIIIPVVEAVNMEIKKTKAEKKLAAGFYERIEAIKTIEDLELFSQNEKPNLVTPVLMRLVGHKIIEHGEKKLGYVFDKKTKKFSMPVKKTKGEPKPEQEPKPEAEVPAETK